MTVHHYTYGTARTIGHEGSYRLHEYTPHDGGRPVVERVLAAGRDDDTPMHSIGTGYHRECSCCWLNITHTVRKHEENLR